MNPSGSILLSLAALGLLGSSLLALVVYLAARTRPLGAWREAEHRARLALEAQMEERQQVEDTLRRTLIMFQLLQDVTSAAGTARSVEEALQSTLDIVCSYTGWPVAHAFVSGRPAGAAPRLQASGIWHLEDPTASRASSGPGSRTP